MENQPRFSEQVAVVAGASEGIGRATVMRLLVEGARVVALARDPAKLGALREAAPSNDSLVTIAADALLPDCGPSAVEAATRRFGRLDILVNCVGGSTVIGNANQPVEQMSDEEWSGMLAFNLQPMFAFTRAAVPAMKRQRAGSIVNLSSVAWQGRGSTTSAAYAAAKGAVNSFTAQVARELAPWNIRVNAAAPGLTLSERMAAAMAKWPDTQKVAVMARMPLGRASTVEEQAAAICFLASKDASYVTGVTLDVGGGV